MLTVYEWEQIRKAYYIEGKSIRQIARETRRARRTIQRMVDSDEPPSYQRQIPIPTRKLGPYKERIEMMLKQNATMPRKQRWTSPRIYEVIRAEGYDGAESTVRHFVAQVRKQLKPPKLYLPLEFDPGTDAQVDWVVYFYSMENIRRLSLMLSSRFVVNFGEFTPVTTVSPIFIFILKSVR